MRSIGPATAFLFIALLGLSGCATSVSSPQPAPAWTTGFWFWQGSSVEAGWSAEPLNVLFVQVGTIRKEVVPAPFRTAGGPTEKWYAYGDWPEQLPAAKQYWAVFRYERQGVPDLRVVPLLAGQIGWLRAAARRRHVDVAGIQLDIDSPTGSLGQYAAFLREVRKGLPRGFQISITALLDWFRNGTAAGAVIDEVDEFVPQFYDIADRESYTGGTSIAARIDAKRWGPAFNRFRKRFRVGISTFGRARLARGEAAPRTGYAGMTFYGDVAPIDVATNAKFQLQAARSPANELVLSYRATRRTRVGYSDFEPGDAMQFVLATPEAVRAAVDSARQMGAHVAGVVFFRWPASNETLAMQPDEVLEAAGVTARPAANRVHAVDGRCAAVACVDLYLESAHPLSPEPLRYAIRSSRDLEYFLPAQGVPVGMAGPSRIEVSLPPYCGRGRLYLGRAVTLEASAFTVEERP